MSSKLAIYGAGGLGREVAVLIRQINSISQKWSLLGYLDDEVARGEIVDGLPVLGNTDYLQTNKEKIAVVIAVGSTDAKKKILQQTATYNTYFPVLVHPQVTITEQQNISLGEGTIITAGNILTCGIRIGSHVLVNLSCTIGHDVIIEDFCSIMPGVHVSGEVHIKEGGYIGTGATIINRIIINENCTIGAGSVVTKDLPSNCTAVGVPAKVIKQNK